MFDLPSLPRLRAALQAALARCELRKADRDHALAALALVDAACCATFADRETLRAQLRQATRHLQLMASTPASLEWDEACASARRAMTAAFFEIENSSASDVR